MNELHEHVAADAHRAMQAGPRPRVTPAELVQSFAARGVTITTGPKGTLRVSPAEMLTPADLEVLMACKPGILAVLARPETASYAATPRNSLTR